MRTNEEIKNSVNSVLKKWKRNAVCHNPRAGRNEYRINLVTIRCLDTNRISNPVTESNLKKGKWPFPRSNEEIEKTVNEYLKKWKRNAVCHNPRAGKTAAGHNLVTIRCLDTNRISNPVQEGSLKEGHWPFPRSNEEIEKTVNEYLKKWKRNAVSHNPRAGKRGTNNLVTIRCLITNRISNPVQETKIKEGHYPFNEEQNRVELNVVHPMFEKLCRKLKITIIKKHYKLAKGCFVDYKIQIPNKPKSDIVELKRSDKFMTSGKNQLQRYNSTKNLIQHNIDNFYKVDPKGSHQDKGFISLKQTELIFKKEINKYSKY